MSHLVRLHSGVLYDPLADEPEAPCVQDIAWGLAFINRFLGHTSRPISVAQHSVNVSMRVPAKHALEALFHDASETVLGDVVSPLKHHPAFAAYCAAEEKVMAAVARTYGFAWPMSPVVKEIDRLVTDAEGCYFLRGFQPTTSVVYGPIEPLSGIDAYHLFIDRYLELTKPSKKGS